MSDFQILPEIVNEMLGEAPLNYEWIPYVTSAILLILGFWLITGLIKHLFDFVFK